MKIINRLVFALSFMFANIASANVILSLDPTTQTSPPGELISVTLSIDGLGDGVPLSLAAYDIDVAFDDSALSFAGYGLFDELGGVADAADLSWGEYTPGVVNVGELSFLSSEDLWAYQPDGFALAELFFHALQPATSAISIVFAELLDAGGSPDPINIIGVNDALVEVPTPTPLMIVAISILIMGIRQKRCSSVNTLS